MPLPVDPVRAGDQFKGPSGVIDIIPGAYFAGSRIEHPLVPARSPYIGKRIPYFSHLGLGPAHPISRRGNPYAAPPARRDDAKMGIEPFAVRAEMRYIRTAAVDDPCGRLEYPGLGPAIQIGRTQNN